jgi:hypothetical protein
LNGCLGGRTTHVLPADDFDSNIMGLVEACLAGNVLLTQWNFAALSFVTAQVE